MNWILIYQIFRYIQFSSGAQSCPILCYPMNHSTQGFLSITNSWRSTKLMCIESGMPSSYLILYRPLLLLPPIPPSNLQIMTFLFLPFKFGCLLLFFFSCLIAVAKTSDVIQILLPILNKNSDNSLSCSWFLRKSFLLFMAKYDFSCGLFRNGSLYQVAKLLELQLHV